MKFRRKNSGQTVQSLYSRAPEFAPIWRFEHNFAEVGVLMLSVYTRHHPDCKNAGDKTWRRCSCPKWIWGSLNGKFIRQSAKTPRWEEAEELRRQLSEGLLPASRSSGKNGSGSRRAGSASRGLRFRPTSKAKGHCRDGRRGLPGRCNEPRRRGCHAHQTDDDLPQAVSTLDAIAGACLSR